VNKTIDYSRPIRNNKVTAQALQNTCRNRTRTWPLGHFSVYSMLNLDVRSIGVKET